MSRVPVYHPGMGNFWIVWAAAFIAFSAYVLVYWVPKMPPGWQRWSRVLHRTNIAVQVVSVILWTTVFR